MLLLLVLALVLLSARASDVDTVLARRVALLKSGWDPVGLAADVKRLLSTVRDDGTWADVDYTSGCAAQRSNWPAQNHWNHIYTLAGGFVGSAPTQYEGDETTLNVTLRAMSWWFSRDFTNPNCLVDGGTSSCPCDTEGLWNTNWYSNVILIPSTVGNTCLLLQSSTSVGLAGLPDGCAQMTLRGFSTFGTGAGFLAGANILQIASIGISGGLLANDTTIIAAAYGHINDEVVVHPEIKVDGIKPDGGFQQHLGVLYNGNYGKAFIESIISLATECAGTAWESAAKNKAAFASLIDGSAWMIYKNVKTNVLHWDFSTLARFISFRTNDLGGLAQTAGILLNVDSIRDLGTLWNDSTLVQVADQLLAPATTANAGGLNGNRMFWANDYMVHRGANYVTSLKMYSSRTSNTECVNLANPLGFHLSDGTVYTYINGDEYEDIAASWDWNLIPGTTVDYGGTPLSCGTAQQTGIENFVGGGSDGEIGVAAMRYTNPITQALKWQKAWFFLPGDVMHVIIAGVNATSNAAEVHSVLDQRRLVGDVVLDGDILESSVNVTSARSLWHGSTGYVFHPSTKFALDVSFGPRTGAWSSIGTSTQPPETVNLFAASLRHLDTRPLEYTVFPARTRSNFVRDAAATRLDTLANDVARMGVWDPHGNVLAAVFWDSGPAARLALQAAGLSLEVSHPVVLLGRFKGHPRTWTITLADPDQIAQTVRLNLRWLAGSLWEGIKLAELNVRLPQGAQAGMSTTVHVL